jgi:hypothetical protein
MLTMLARLHLLSTLNYQVLNIQTEQQKQVCQKLHYLEIKQNERIQYITAGVE